MKNLVKLFTSGCLLISLNGCMTFSGDKLTDLEPIKPITSPYIEVNVGDFTAHLEESKELTSNEAGRIINDKMMENWKDNNYIRDFTLSDNNNLTEKVQYRLLLRGHQEDTSSSIMQFLSAITFLLIPATSQTSYDLVYELEEVQTEKKYFVVVTDNISTTTWLLFFPALPFSSIGANNTHQRIAEYVYQTFVKQGAFNHQN
ncbi:MAG: hypothetical protein DRQ62_10820 [Gammaproteobacteria bacterium]|nr:MAG: hypothetical protein DRQ62_10820 [Gammaproteobacteria bacterium]